MPHLSKLLVLGACFVLSCSLVTDLSGLGGADASSEAAPPDSSPSDSAVEAGFDVTPPDAGSDVNDAADAPSAVVSNVQIGAMAYVSNGGSVSPTLPNPSSNGTLLVATVSCDSTAANVSASSGWTLAVTGTGFANGSSIWYASGGGITTATFTSTNGGAVAAQISEWSGVTTVDQKGTASTSSALTSLTVSTSAPLAFGGELGITAFGQATGQQALITYTPDTNWTALGATGTTRMHYTADYRIGVGPGTVSETVTSSAAATWVGVIATFK